jgi:hypothetical protein
MMETNLGLIIAIVGSAIAIVGVIVAMFIWIRGEANADRRENNSDHKEILSLIRAIELEIRDFHHKLLRIEEKK